MIEVELSPALGETRTGKGNVQVARKQRVRGRMTPRAVALLNQ